MTQPILTLPLGKGSKAKYEKKRKGAKYDKAKKALDVGDQPALLVESLEEDLKEENPFEGKK